MARFLKGPTAVAIMKTLKYVSCNHFRDADTMTTAQRRAFDVISYESNSYFTDAHAIWVPIGLGQAELPPRARHARMWVKSSCQAMMSPARSSGSQAHSQENIITPAHSQGEHAHSTGSQPRRTANLAITEPTVTDRIKRLDDMPNNAIKAIAVKKFFFERRDAGEVRAVINDMPTELKDWMTSDWPKQ